MTFAQTGLLMPAFTFASFVGGGASAKGSAWPGMRLRTYLHRGSKCVVEDEEDEDEEEEDEVELAAWREERDLVCA